MSNRPIIPVPLTQTDRILDGIAIALIVISFIVAWYGWSKLPDTIPIHFDLAGRPNNWGNKSILWLFPIISIGMFALFTVLRQYPHTFNYVVQITEENALQQYRLACGLLAWLKMEFALLALVITWMTTQLAAQGSTWYLVLSPIAFVILNIVTVAVYIVRSRQG